VSLRDKSPSVPARAVAIAVLVGAMASIGAEAQPVDAGTLPVSSDASATPSVGDAGVGAIADATSDAAVMADASAAMSVNPAAPFGESEVPEFLATLDKRVKDERPAPTADQIAGLTRMEAEVAGFKRSGDAYKETLVAILRREYLRQRRQRSEGYGRQIAEEEKLQDASTLEAIAMFEGFVKQYPNDPTYTPDAMFRLGELYFERSAIQYQVAVNAVLDARDKGQELTEPAKDFAPTIELYREIIRRFPQYQRIDGVYYLIGYCLNEMGQPDQARIAWLNLVCANQYDFKATLDAVADDKLAKQAERESKNPSLTIGTLTSSAPKGGPLGDPYGTCKPAVTSSRFSSETWLRIGEYHFDYDVSTDGMAYAVSAYRKVLTDPTDRNYNLALYKVAWSYYRAFRYPEAVREFAALVQWSDDERKRTGKAGSELRAEAIQYLAITFAYDDWNENQVPDPQEGQPTGLQRVQDASLLPQDREWTAEVYQALGDVWFDEAKYGQAIEAWNLALKRWPNHPKAPEIQNNIARAYARNNEAEESVKARALLGNYSEGSAWWNANMDHPIEQRRAEELAEEAVVNAAIFHHQEAQRMRRLGVQDKNPELIRMAQEQYALAARAYRGYIQRYPNSPQAYELQYNLADALFWSENYEESAREYAAVRDSNLDDKYLSESARRVVEAYKRLAELAEERGEIAQRTEPPAAAGTPLKVSPVAMPPLYQRLAQAREIYLARVDDARDTEQVRPAYAYNNTLLLYQYGYWTQAKERFSKIYTEHCSGSKADETGRIAWINLRNMAVTLEQLQEVEQLGADLASRNCTFSPSGVAAKDVDCNDPKNSGEPQCLAGADLTNIQYKKAVDVFVQAEKAKGQEQVKLYEDSATMLIQAVDKEPNHPQAPLALEKAAIALERTSRFESAARLYQRIIDEVGPRQGKDATEQAALDGILANAYFRLAFNANRFFDYDRAIENYRILADSERFKKSKDAQMPARRQDGLINAAYILEFQQQYARAADYFQRAADIITDPKDKVAAEYKVAEMSFKQQKWTDTVTKMKAFVAKNQSNPVAGEQVVQAYWRIAQAKKNSGKAQEYDAALNDVVSAFARSGQQPGSYAAEYGAQAKFTLVDKDLSAFENLQIKPGQPATMKAYVDDLKRQIESGASQAKARTDSYEAVMTYRRPTWLIAAYVRQGRVYEVLAKAVLNTPFVVPNDMKKQMTKLPDYAREEVRLQVEDSIRQLLDQQTRPIECFAVVRYALAARAAKAGSVDNEYTQQAITRLAAYGDERIGQCVAEQQAKDSSFQAYVPGEFSRAPRGAVLPMPAGVTPPSLGAEVR
jgi:tetratricopeptide (TPR) repeat protein